MKIHFRDGPAEGLAVELDPRDVRHELLVARDGDRAVVAGTFPPPATRPAWTTYRHETNADGVKVYGLAPVRETRYGGVDEECG